MLHITLGGGKYCVAASHRISDGMPQLTIRQLAAPVAVGELLEQGSYPKDAYELIIDVETPGAAGVLLVVAQGIAFHHGIKP